MHTLEKKSSKLKFGLGYHFYPSLYFFSFFFFIYWDFLLKLELIYVTLQCCEGCLNIVYG